jgi:membrane protease YdiL (CAAX protease family)
MNNFGPHEILLALLSLLVVAVVSGMLMAWAWLMARLVSRQPILPEKPLVDRPEPRWGIGTILAVILVYSLLVTVLRPPGDDKLSWTQKMQLNAVLELVLLILVPSVVRMTSGARLRDFGLSFERWERQAACGFVATLVAAPLVYAIQFAVMRIWTPEPHPLMKMMLQEFSLGVGVLAILTAVILAPIFEELAFRGLLQGWLVGSLKRSAIPAPALVTDEISAPGESELSPAPDFWNAGRAIDDPSPVVKTPLPAPAEVPHRGWLGVVLTAILFAAVHAEQWPAPIPLFALALVIGTVYYRTGSLIAAICMHASFNGMSTLMLFIAALAGQKLGAGPMT